MENYQNTEQRELQLVELQLLEKFVEICEREKLRYFVMYGTCLGAVRHKGFIPWDDDVDVGMPRSDYEKFLKVSPTYLNEEMKLVTWKNTLGYLFYFSRISCPKRKVVVFSGAKERVQEAWIDIFPLDGLPNGNIKREVRWLYLQLVKYEYMISAFDIVNLQRKNRPWYQQSLIFLCRHTPLHKLFSINKMREKLDCELIKSSFDESEYIFCIMGAYRHKEVLDKRIFGEGRVLNFENMKVNAPEKTHRYLKQLYGEYMTLPPAAERNWHGTEVVSEEEGDL